MPFDEFIECLKRWVDEVNEANKGKGRIHPDFLVLDKNYFDFNNANNQYSVNKDKIEDWKKAKLLFVGDNPGIKEKENLEYFYYNPEHKVEGYWRSTGYKFKRFIDQFNISMDEVIKFNKCLVSTGSTVDLKGKDLHLGLNISFIRLIHECFPDVFILFSGIAGIKNGNSIFSSFYRDLSSVINEESTGFMRHISRRKFPDKYSKQLNFGNAEDLKSVARQFKNELFPDSSPAQEGTSETHNNLPTNHKKRDDGDSDSSASPVPVR